jgi:hypothetical protein
MIPRVDDDTYTSPSCTVTFAPGVDVPTPTLPDDVTLNRVRPVDEVETWNRSDDVGADVSTEKYTLLLVLDATTKVFVGVELPIPTFSLKIVSVDVPDTAVPFAA